MVRGRRRSTQRATEINGRRLIQRILTIPAPQSRAEKPSAFGHLYTPRQHMPPPPPPRPKPPRHAFPAHAIAHRSPTLPHRRRQQQPRPATARSAPAQVRDDRSDRAARWRRSFPPQPQPRAANPAATPLDAAPATRPCPPPAMPRRGVGQQAARRSPTPRPPPRRRRPAVVTAMIGSAARISGSSRLARRRTRRMSA